MLELGIKSLVAYLLGSLLGSLLMGRLRGVDIRQQGSGNAGGTNALRTQGWRFALGVVVIDVGKAVLAVGWLPGLDLPGIGMDPGLDRG
ncbi:MAG TPA: glycerol-3-phosphate acyltransferase, partial [Steroidobacteraceae bacterium]|nr:glycerol-3-phosphate acyltransferase [Steroidobacteraceae bacterium]